jgi:hypothetical protein
MLFMPESPRWLGKIGKKDQSRQVLSQIYIEDHLEDKISELEQEVQQL